MNITDPLGYNPRNYFNKIYIIDLFLKLNKYGKVINVSVSAYFWYPKNLDFVTITNNIPEMINALEKEDVKKRNHLYNIRQPTNPSNKSTLLFL